MTSKFLTAPLCALALAGCNSSAPRPQAQVDQRPQTQAAALPSGAGCSDQIARYKAVIDSDHQTGNVNDSVFRQIDGEISAASSACASGNDGQAQALVRASKSRHGYPG